MHGRERKPVSLATDAVTKQALASYERSEEVRTELLSTKRYVVHHCHANENSCWL
jgi:hypothetical protein